jgi:hypothetical protein
MTEQEKIDLLLKAGWTEDDKTGDLVKGEMRFHAVDDAYMAEFGVPPPDDL